MRSKNFGALVEANSKSLLCLFVPPSLHCVWRLQFVDGVLLRSQLTVAYNDLDSDKDVRNSLVTTCGCASQDTKFL